MLFVLPLVFVYLHKVKTALKFLSGQSGADDGT